VNDLSAIANAMRTGCPAMHLRQASRVLARVYDAAFRPLGLELSQLPVVATVAARGDAGISVGELARALVMDRTTVTRAIRPLEKAGFLRVARSLEDARSKIVVTTRAGERVVRASYPIWERTTRRIREMLGASRVDALNVELAKLIAAGSRLADRTRG
jgi:DNA-binding MarR family transcriptional regulator